MGEPRSRMKRLEDVPHVPSYAKFVHSSSSSSSISKPIIPLQPTYESEVDQETKLLNNNMKKKNANEVNQILDKILNQILVKYSNNEVVPRTWCLHTELSSRFKSYQILLVAHWKRPIRMLVAVSKATNSDVRGVMPEFHYELHKLVIRRSKRERHEQLVVSKIRGNLLYTTRRGCYAVNLEIFNKGYQARLNEKGKLIIKESEQHVLTQIYNRFVRGMTVCIPSNFPRVEKDKGIEQFLLFRYPTKEWYNTVENIECQEAELAMQVLDEDNDNGRQTPSSEEQDETLRAEKRKCIQAASAFHDHHSFSATDNIELDSEHDYFDSLLFDLGFERGKIL